MPKVLITNGSVIGTWYAGKTGKIYDISHVSTEVYMMKENDLPAPFHKAVRKEDGELLYTEAEYNKILQQREKAINDLAKHAQTIVDMQKRSYGFKMKSICQGIKWSFPGMCSMRSNHFGITAGAPKISSWSPIVLTTENGQPLCISGEQAPLPREGNS